MSTDTDRIVNFCQSFHQFWSLPFQIGVSLYLLEQQVHTLMLLLIARTKFSDFSGQSHYR